MRHASSSSRLPSGTTASDPGSAMSSWTTAYPLPRTGHRGPTPEECAYPQMKHLLTGNAATGGSFTGADRVTFTGPACGN